MHYAICESDLKVYLDSQEIAECCRQHSVEGYYPSTEALAAHLTEHLPTDTLTTLKSLQGIGSKWGTSITELVLSGKLPPWCGVYVRTSRLASEFQVPINTIYKWKVVSTTINRTRFYRVDPDLLDCIYNRAMSVHGHALRTRIVQTLIRITLEEGFLCWKSEPGYSSSIESNAEP